jgi:hypothetical protein
MIEAVSTELDSQPVSAPARIPMGTILGELADAMDSTKKSLDRYKQVTVMQPLRELKEEISRLTDEELETLKKVAEAKENQNLWSFGHLISSAAYASLSIMFGAYLFATGAEQGEKFILGGSALLANTLMDHLGGWTLVSNFASLGNDTIEQTLRVTLPIATTLIAMIYSAHNLASLALPHKELVKMIDKFMSWINVGIQVGNTYASLKLSQTQRNLTLIEGKVSQTTMRIEPLNLRNETLTNSAKQINDAFKGGIKKIIKGTTAIPAE